MITSIELKNFKTHKHTMLNFSRGTNVLVGLMGAGKSSIMDAISYGLFGTFPSIQHRRVNVEELIMSRPVQESSASILLNFTFDGNDYCVERTISSSEGAKATLKKNGAYLQSQPQRVSEEIARILKVDYDLFSRAIYSEQNRLDYFLELRSSERKGQIDELLGLDKFALAQENATSLLNKIKDTISEHEKIINSFDLQKSSGELLSFEKELSELSDKKAQIEKDHAISSAKAKEIESKLDELKQQLQKKMQISKQLAELKSKLEILNFEISKLSKENLPALKEIAITISESKSSLSNLKAEEEKAREHERKLFRELSEIDAQLSQLKQKLAEKQRLELELKGDVLGTKEKSLQKIQQELEELEKNLALCNAQKDETSKWILELNKHLSTCPVCDRELDEQMKSKLIEAKKALVEKANLSIGDAQSSIKQKKMSLEKERKELDVLRLSNSKLKEHLGAEKQLEEFSEKQNAAKEKYEYAKSKSELAKKSVESTTAKLSELTLLHDKSQRLENHQKQSLQINNDFLSKSQEFSSINVDENLVENMQKEFIDANAKQIKLGSETVAHIRYISDKQKLIDEKKGQIAKINKMLSEINEKKAATENLAKFKNALELTQRDMRTKLVGAINNVMQQIWPELYPYGDYGAIMLEPKSNDYLLKVRTTNASGEKWEEVNGIASGGERSIACLALRVAFALVLVPNLKWIILDEPTHNIDEQGMGRFIKVFNETLPKIIDQIFIITHDEQLKQAASAKTYLLTRNKAEGAATIVQEQ